MSLGGPEADGPLRAQLGTAEEVKPGSGSHSVAKNRSCSQSRKPLLSAPLFPFQSLSSMYTASNPEL